MTVGAYVLAGGGGSRFSGDRHKLLADFRGRPVISWVIEQAVEAHFDGGVHVVAGAVAVDDVLPESVGMLRNERWREGIATSLAVAVDHARGQGHQAIVVGLGDQPLIPTSAWVAVREAPHPVAVATYEGRRRNPVKLRADVWDLLPREGDEGARVVIRERPDLVGEVACEGIPADIDTVEDLTEWS